MAGIGVKLNKIYSKKSIFINITGLAYSTVVSIAPMVLIILTVFALQWAVGFDTLDYSSREIFSCTMLYTFIFGLITTAPLNAVLSRYMSDMVYGELYEEIMPSYYTGLLINAIISAIPAVPFMIYGMTQGIDPIFAYLGLFGYMCLILVFYSMLYLSICKDYGKIASFYFLGMVGMFIIGYVLVKVFDVPIIYGMQISLDLGLLIIAALEYAQLKAYFRDSSHNYWKVLSYFKEYWPLVISNTCYTLGLYAHNFVFWTTDMKMVVANTFVCAQPYDMATFLAMVTNLSATIIFISNAEMHFSPYYKNYTESVIGGRLLDVENAQKRMFTALSQELMSLVRVQFIVTVILFLAMVIIMPFVGVSGLVLEIYPSLAAAYFILFIMYSAIIFLYYYNDNAGAMLVSVSFLAVSVIGSVIASHYDYIWYGTGVFAGALIGWILAYFRMRWVERHLEEHIFCTGTIMTKVRTQKPPDIVYIKQRDEREQEADPVIEPKEA